MKFLNPQGLWLGLALILIIILYFKKEQEVNCEISSIKLWEEVLKEVEGLKISKINNYLLLILQIVVGILIVFALGEPQLIKGSEKDEVTLLLDCSISMKAMENGTSHFETGKEEAKKYVDNLNKDTKINLILMKDNWEICVDGGDKREILRALKNIDCSKEPLNLGQTSNIDKLFEGEKVAITDKDLPLKYKVIKIGKKFDNVGIVYANYDYYDNNLIYRVKNYTSKEKEVSLSITNEIGSKDIEKTILSPKEEKDLFFKPTEDSNILNIRIEDEDMLLEDNKYLVPIGDEYKKKILLVGDNFFLENALKSIPSITYLKKDTLTSEDGEYDLYIISKDITIPKNISDKNIWCLNPPKNMIEGVAEGVKEVKFKDDFVSSVENAEDIYVEGSPYLKHLDGFRTILEVDSKPIMICGIESGRKVIYSTFNLQESNFGMNPYFPIFIYDIIDWILDGKNISTDMVVENPPSKLVIEYMNTADEVLESQKPEPAVIKFREIFIVLAIVFLIVEWKVYDYVAYR